MKIFLFFSTLFLSSLSAMVRTGVEIQGGDGYYENGYYEEDGNGYYYQQTWYGPGFYNGIWFGNQWDYDDWHHRHNHYFPPSPLPRRPLASARRKA